MRYIDLRFTYLLYFYLLYKLVCCRRRLDQMRVWVVQ